MKREKKYAQAVSVARDRSGIWIRLHDGRGTFAICKVTRREALKLADEILNRCEGAQADQPEMTQ